MILLVKIGIMICDRNRTCTGYKCKSIIERDGAFAKYPKDEPIEVVGWERGCWREVTL